MQERQERQRYALQTIFSFFLGLMVVALIGVGVNTFYPSPEQELQKKMQDIQRAQEDIDPAMKGTPNATITPEQEAKLKQLRDEQRTLQDQMQAGQETWARNTSIIVITFATVVMALSLVRAEQLKVISNGLLLGGIFTMVYGTFWVILSGKSTARFLVMLFALAVTLGLGYLKFVSGRTSGAAPAAAPSGEAASPDVADLTTRVEALEARAAAAAEALAPRER